jgi:aerobic carbon-monoxide dehydrogenase medium subunit
MRATGAARARSVAAVKPAPFAYHRPRSREDVDRLLADLGDEAKILAGGQSLIPILNMRLAAPAHLIDINALEGEPDEPVLHDGHVTLGPLVRHRAAERSRLVGEQLRLLPQTLVHVAHPAIRSRGTVVGSIAHADPAAELPAAMAVLEGEARVRSARGSRTVAARDLFVSHLETSLEPDEWIEEVRLPIQGDRGSAVVEFARRHGDYALCGVVALAARGDGDGFRIALSYIGMGATPLRLELPPLDATDVAGGPLEEAVRSIVRQRLEPEEDIHATARYRLWLAERLGTRAGRSAVAAARGA